VLWLKRGCCRSLNRTRNADGVSAGGKLFRLSTVVGQLFAVQYCRRHGTREGAGWIGVREDMLLAGSDLEDL
jgi:hypothetical protein